MLARFKNDWDFYVLILMFMALVAFAETQIAHYMR